MHIIKFKPVLLARICTVVSTMLASLIIQRNGQFPLPELTQNPDYGTLIWPKKLRNPNDRQKTQIVWEKNPDVVTLLAAVAHNTSVT